MFRPIVLYFFVQCALAWYYLQDGFTEVYGTSIRGTISLSYDFKSYYGTIKAYTVINQNIADAVATMTTSYIENASNILGIDQGGLYGTTFYVNYNESVYTLFQCNATLVECYVDINVYYTRACSGGCPTSYLSDGECDYYCNTEECNYDQVPDKDKPGDCLCSNIPCEYDKCYRKCSYLKDEESCNFSNCISRCVGYCSDWCSWYYYNGRKCNIPINERCTDGHYNLTDCRQP